MVSRQIIALSGPRACGKSTIANHLVNNHGYTRIAFADALRDIAAIAGPDFINDRLYLARLGEKLRAQVPDFLLQAVNNRLQSIEGHVVIEDIRFPAEVDYCQSIEVTTIRFDIPIEIQRERLANRDGKVGFDAESLITCMDEHALNNVVNWNYVIPAVGDFRELAAVIHTGVS
ncbi:MAG: AAA family ATPase, partial [Flavobacteriales bacterium]|nr:AAA family ATPase [Flavobacteriales bacterium]